MRRAEREDLLARLLARVDLVDRVWRAMDATTRDTDAVRVAADAVGVALDVLRAGEAVVRVTGLDGREIPTSRSAGGGDPLDRGDCHAVDRGDTVVVAESTTFDACRHLRSREAPTSAVCIPVASRGRVLGVVQWTGPPGEPLHPVAVGTIEVVAHLLGAHLSILRRGGEDDLPRMDPLTGLLNPRSTHLSIRRLVRDLVPFSVGVCDIDGFADLNEDRGQDVGDRVLRLFSRVLTATLRPDDLVGRTDVDVFTIAFPTTSAIDAAQALERVREALVLALSVEDLPQFTVSCGVADSDQGDSIDAIVETAELAVALAKRSGGNRVVVAGELTTHLPGDADR